jgi:hypothetical protein
VSTEEDESDERGTAADDPGNVEESTADDPGNVEGESTADDPGNVEGESTADDPVNAEEESTADDPGNVEEESTADDPVNAEEESTADDPGNVEESTADDPVSGHWLYIGIGLLTAVVAWLLIPLFGIGPVYAGYKLYDSEERTISAAILVVLGVLPLVFWVLFIFQTL